MADGGTDGCHRGNREEDEPVSKHKMMIQSGCVGWRAEAVRDGRTSLARPTSQPRTGKAGKKKNSDQLNLGRIGNHPG